MTLFLDTNAHLSLNAKALAAFVNFNNSAGGHGHAMTPSLPGRSAAAELEKARETIARLIGAKNSKQIVFTTSCTQACEWGLEILNSRKFSKVYCSTVEHPAVSFKASELFGNNDLFVDKDGTIACGFSPAETNSALICIHVQNELGTLQPIETIKVPFFCDMSQSLGKIPVNVSKIPNLKIATFGGHKFGGPVNFGFMYLQDPSWWKEFGSGSRYYIDRPGTPDVGLAVAGAVALEDALKTLSVRYQKALEFKKVLESNLPSHITIMGKNGTRIPHVSYLCIGDRMGSFVVNQLSNEGIYVGLGAACGSLTSKSSPLMRAIGHSGRSDAYIRISNWGYYGGVEAQRVVKVLKKYCTSTKS